MSVSQFDHRCHWAFDLILLLFLAISGLIQNQHRSHIARLETRVDALMQMRLDELKASLPVSWGEIDPHVHIEADRPGGL